MKNKVIVGVILFLLSFIFIKPVHAVEEKYNFILEEQIVTNSETIYINNNLQIQYDVYTKVITYKGTIEIPDVYVTHEYVNDTLYICSDTCFYTVNTSILSYISNQVSFCIVDLEISDYIYIVGNELNNPIINIYDFEGNLLKTKKFTSNDYGTFRYIKIFNNSIFLILEKDAFFNNENFLKVGNKNEIKSVIIKMDSTLEIDNIYYFNEYKKYEIINSFIIDANIKVILKSNNNTFLYIFDKNLNLIYKEIIDKDDNQIYLIPTYNGQNLLLEKNKINTKLFVFDKGNKNYIYNFQKIIKGFGSFDGGIYINIDKNLELYSEYHIDKKECLYLDRLSYNIQSTDHIQVSSFFEKINLSLDYVTPFHEYMISGEYIGVYSFKNKFERTTNIETKIVVKDFVNVVDGGVYPLKTKLMFFGNGYLNGEKINNGHSINIVGDYQLVIKDINENTKIINFKVVDEYYKDNDHYIMDVDYKITKGNKITLSYLFNNIGEAKYFIINDEPIDNFETDGNTIYITLDKFSQWGYQDIYVSQVVFDNKSVNLNQRITVLTLKDKPIVNISSEGDENSYLVNLNIIDYDKTIINIYEEENIFYITYELGDGKVIREPLFEVEGSNINYQVNRKESGVDIVLNLNKDLEKIIIDGNIVYEKIIDNTNLYIIIASATLSIIILFITLLLLIIKKKRTSVRI